MKVIIIKNVQNLGNSGEIKNVADGYARNFLIPGGYAKIATKDAIKQVEELEEKKKKKAEEELKTAEELATKLENISVIIKAKAEKSGKLYAAINSEEISKALGKKGFNISEDKIIIKEPIKEIGDYEVMINLNHGLEARINVLVESEKVE